MIICWLVCTLLWNTFSFCELCILKHILTTFLCLFLARGSRQCMELLCRRICSFFHNLYFLNTLLSSSSFSIVRFYSIRLFFYWQRSFIEDKWFFFNFYVLYKNHFYLLKIIESGTLPHYLELIMKPLLIKMIFLEEKMIIK